MAERKQYARFTQILRRINCFIAFATFFSLDLHLHINGSWFELEFEWNGLRLEMNAGIEVVAETTQYTCQSNKLCVSIIRNIPTLLLLIKSYGKNNGGEYSAFSIYVLSANHKTQKWMMWKSILSQNVITWSVARCIIRWTEMNMIRLQMDGNGMAVCRIGIRTFAQIRKVLETYQERSIIHLWISKRFSAYGIAQLDDTHKKFATTIETMYLYILNRQFR